MGVIAQFSKFKLEGRISPLQRTKVFENRMRAVGFRSNEVITLSSILKNFQQQIC